MGEEDAILMKEFRDRLGITQKRAATILGCSRVLVARVETGWNRLVRQRRKRMVEAVAVFESGGMEAVEAMKAFTCIRVPKPRQEVPPGDREEMKIWRIDSGLGLWDATEELGLGVHSIRAIERGRMRITERVRANMHRGRQTQKGSA